MKADVKSPQQFRLRQHLKKVQNEYDYCIIDTSPSVSIVNINGLAAADSVYLPVRCDGGSLLGVAITVNLVRTVQEYNPRLEIGGSFFHSGMEEKMYLRLSMICYMMRLENTCFRPIFL